MKNKKTLFLKVVLVMTLLLNAVELTFVGIKALAQDEVVEVVTYNDDKSVASISFDASKLIGTDILSDIVTPTGETMDVDGSFEVEENGTYGFTLNFVDELDESVTSSEKINVDVTDIKVPEVAEIVEEADTEDTSDAVMNIAPSAAGDHVFSTPGVTLTNYSVSNNAEFGNHFYVYLKAGEHFKFTAKYGGAGDWDKAATKGSYYITSPDGTQETVNFPEGTSKNNGNTIPHATRGVFSTTITATTDGIYSIAPVRTANDFDVWHDLSFNVEDASGTYMPGRVWSNNIQLKQSHLRNDNGRYMFVEDFTFYHVTSTGYIYKQELFGYNGINSVIFSDPVGNMITEGDNCVPIYADIPQMSTKYSALNENQYCQSQVSYNNLFLENPSADLPASGSVPLLNTNGTTNGSKEVHVLPNIANFETKMVDFNFVQTNEDSYAGKFSANITNAQGFADIEFEINDGTTTKTITRKMFINENGPSTYIWDGKDDEGNKVPFSSKVNVQVAIRTAGEIHFNQQDVEQRLGMTVTRLTGTDPSTIGEDTLYYDASKLPINFNRAQNIKMPNPVSGSYASKTEPGRHSWNYIGRGTEPTSDNRNTYAPRLASFEGRPTTFDPDSWQNPNKHNSSLGDGNYMLDWTYEKLNLVLDLELELLQPGLTIDKVVDIEQTLYEDNLQLTYSIQVTNNEEFEVTNYTLVDKLANTTLTTYSEGSIKVDGKSNTDLEDTDSAHFDSDTDSIVVKIDSLKSGESIVVTFKVDVTEDAIGKLINNKALVYNNLTPELPMYSDNVATEVHDMSIRKEVDKTTSFVGDTITYKIFVTNESEFVANNYHVSDDLNKIGAIEYLAGSLSIDGVLVDDADDLGFASVINNLLSVQLDAMAPKQVVEIAFTVTVLEDAKGTLLTNVATLLHAPDNTDKVNINMNTPIDSNEVATEIPDVTITKTVDKAYAQVGDTLLYTVSVTNNSNFDVADYLVTDKIIDIDKVTYVKDSIKLAGNAQTDAKDTDNASYANDTVSVQYDTIASKETITFTFEVLVDEAAQGHKLTNVAVLESSNPQLPPLSSEEVPTLINTIAIEKLVDKATATVGETLTYSLVVSNNSNHDVTDLLVTDVLNDLTKVDYVTNSIKVDGVTMSDVKDSDAASYDKGTLSVAIPTIAANEQIVITFEVVVKAAAIDSNITNTAILQDLNVPTNDSTSNEVTTYVPKPADPDVISIEKLVDKATASVGETLTYSLVVKNDSKHAVSDLLVTDVLADLNKVDYVVNSIKVDGVAMSDAKDSDAASYSKGTLNVTIPTIEAGKQVIINFEVVVKPEAIDSTITNTAILQDLNNPTNDSTSNEVTTLVPQPIDLEMVPPVEPVTDLTIVKSVDQKTAKVGDTLTYSITVANTGKHNAYGVIVEDVINDLKSVNYIKNSITVDGVEMTDAKDTDDSSYSKGTVNVLIPMLEPKQEVTITFSVVVTEKASGHSVTNVALLTDPNNPNNDTTSNEVVTQIPSLSLVKSVDNKLARPSDSLTYTIEVTNNSDFAVSGYTLYDKITNLEYVSYNVNSIMVDGNSMTDAIDSDNASYVDGTVSVAIPTLEKDQKMTISFSVTVLDAAANNKITNVAVLTDDSDSTLTTDSNEVVTTVTSNIPFDLPHTGINNQLVLFITMMFISSLAVLVLGYRTLNRR